MVRRRGKAGVGAPGDATVDSMNSTSLASMLSMLLLGVKMIGPGVEMSDEVASRGIRRDGEGEGDGSRCCTLRRTEALAKGESGAARAELRSGLPLCPMVRRAEPPERSAIR